MDGAAKFVRGDAIAGLLITFINLAGGLIIGVGQMGVSLGEAVQSYTLLTVGDGLVSQIPALVVSTAAGLLVAKAGVADRTDRALFGQLSAHPRALATTSGLLAVLGLLPGLPMLPFLLLAGASSGLAWHLGKQQAAAAGAETEAAAPALPREEPISSALAMDPLRLELGYGLLPLIGDGGGPRLTDQIKALRRQLAGELGFVMPPVRIQDNIQLPANTYVVKLKEIETGRGELRPNLLLVMDPKGDRIGLPGEDTTEPTFGLPAKWIAESLREEASFRGLTVVDPATVLTIHLTEVIKDNLAELLSFAETQD
jgi:flagellar biosynthesis protein FlhA